MAILRRWECSTYEVAIYDLFYIHDGICNDPAQSLVYIHGITLQELVDSDVTTYRLRKKPQMLPLAAVYTIDRGVAIAALEHSSLRWNDASNESATANQLYG